MTVFSDQTYQVSNMCSSSISFKLTPFI